MSIQSEGFQVAERLAEHGIAAFVLEYRTVPCEGEAVAEMMHELATDPGAVLADMNRIGTFAAADGEQAVRLVRAMGDALYETWRGARLPVELHMYARGGHGFGMRTQQLPSDSWIDGFLDWFDATGLHTSVIGTA
jgi:hypothetical protein